MKFLIGALLPLLVACQGTEDGKWRPIRTSAIPSPYVDVFHDHEGWSVGNHRYADTDRLLSAIVPSGKGVVMITLAKKSSLEMNDLTALAVKLSEGGERRVFYHQSRGNIDSIESSFEFSR